MRIHEDEDWCPDPVAERRFDEDGNVVYERREWRRAERRDCWAVSSETRREYRDGRLFREELLSYQRRDRNGTHLKELGHATPPVFRRESFFNEHGDEIRRLEDNVLWEGGIAEDTYSYRYEHDERGNLILRECIRERTGTNPYICTSLSFYRYDENGTKRGETAFEDGLPHEELRYDRHGNLVYWSRLFDKNREGFDADYTEITTIEYSER